MNDYAHKQKRRDNEYAEYWKTLTPAEKKQFARAGIDGPDLPKYDTGKRETDTPEIAEMIACRQSDASVFHVREPDFDEAKESPSASNATDSMEVLRQVMGIMVSTQNTRLSVECVALLLGLAFEGDTMTGIARKHRITRAAVSKRCIELANKLGIEHSRALRKLTARHSYATAQNQRLR